MALHRENTVRLIDAGKRFARDPIADFKAAAVQGVGGIRTAAQQVLNPIDDIDLSSRIRDAILFGPRNKPVDAGDYAQVQTIGIERSLKEQEPHLFLNFPEFTLASGVPQTLYRPNRPEQLHRIIWSPTDQNAVATIRFGRTLPIVPETTFFDMRGLLETAYPVDTDYGKIGILLTPNNPLIVEGSGNASLHFNLHLSTAQLG